MVQLERIEDTTPLRRLKKEQQRLIWCIVELVGEIQKQRDLAAKDLVAGWGPVIANLEIALKKHQIKVQACHSRRITVLDTSNLRSILMST